MLQVQTPSRFPVVGAAIGVLAVAALLFFARLGDRALWTMELRWAEIPREMRLSQDYFWPTINGRSYYDKPLGSYWLVLACGWLTGTLDETAARLPCALSGFAGVALLMLLARRLYDGRTAVLSGLVLATSFGFVFFARTASSDMENVTGELAALLLFLRYEKKPAGPWLIGFWLIMALTSLTKGLLGFALPLLVLGTYSCLSDGRGELVRGFGRGSLADRLRWILGRCQWLLSRWSVVGFVVAATVYLGPFAVSWARTGSTQGLFLVYRENVHASSARTITAGRCIYTPTWSSACWPLGQLCCPRRWFRKRGRAPFFAAKKGARPLFRAAAVIALPACTSGRHSSSSRCRVRGAAIT